MSFIIYVVNVSLSTFYKIVENTYFTLQEEKYLRSMWGQDIVLYCHSSQSRVVALPFGCNTEHNIHQIYKPDSGNFLLIDITLNGCRMSIGNIYGPNSDSP